MRTVFNLLGPLTNPAGATAQIIGAPSLEPEELRNVGPIGRKLLDFGAAPP